MTYILSELKTSVNGKIDSNQTRKKGMLNTFPHMEFLFSFCFNCCLCVFWNVNWIENKLILCFQLCKDIWQLPTRFSFLFLSTYCYSHCKAQLGVLEHRAQIVKRPQQPFGDGIKVVNPFATPADYTTNYTM